MPVNNIVYFKTVKKNSEQTVMKLISNVAYQKGQNKIQQSIKMKKWKNILSRICLEKCIFK